MHYQPNAFLYPTHVQQQHALLFKQQDHRCRIRSLVCSPNLSLARSLPALITSLNKFTAGSGSSDLIVDCTWSAYSAWTPCSKSCEAGIQERNRTIIQQAQGKGALPCRGRAFETRLCNRQKCGSGRIQDMDNNPKPEQQLHCGKLPHYRNDGWTATTTTDSHSLHHHSITPFCCPCGGISVFLCSDWPKQPTNKTLFI